MECCYWWWRQFFYLFLRQPHLKSYFPAVFSRTSPYWDQHKCWIFIAFLVIPPRRGMQYIPSIIFYIIDILAFNNSNFGDITAFFCSMNRWQGRLWNGTTSPAKKQMISSCFSTFGFPPYWFYIKKRDTIWFLYILLALLYSLLFVTLQISVPSNCHIRCSLSYRYAKHLYKYIQDLDNFLWPSDSRPIIYSPFWVYWQACDILTDIVSFKTCFIWRLFCLSSVRTCMREVCYNFFLPLHLLLPIKASFIHLKLI